MHGSGFPPGTAEAFDDSGNLIATADSRPATRFGDPANFVALDPSATITRIDFSGGVIDNFTFTVPAAPPPSPSATASPTAEPSASFTSTPPSSPTPTETFGPLPCIGDCNGDERITIAELVRGVNIALGRSALDDCARFDDDGDGAIAINELIGAVRAALNGCDPEL